MLTPKTKRNIQRIIPFGIMWMIFGVVYLLIEKGILGDSDFYPSTGNPYNFEESALTAVFSITLTGLLIGSFEVLFLSKLFRKSSFTVKLLLKTFIYVFIIIFILISLSFVIMSKQINANLFNTIVLDQVLVFVKSFAFISMSVYIAALIMMSLFFSEVSENLGLAVIHNFFMGKYHKPREEERIFMFLDMKSSTTIAEEMGHVKYFEMLKEYYADLTNSIINFSGEIYQYVGDEIVISWKNHKGNEINCIDSFFDMKDALKKQSDKYHTRFGVHPAFKAGLHYGRVTTGEIGVAKKDIIFTGDVLNTTARLQGLCNENNVDILISNALYQKVKNETKYNFTSVGEKRLRGRIETIELFTISRNNPVSGS